MPERQPIADLVKKLGLAGLNEDSSTDDLVASIARVRTWRANGADPAIEPAIGIEARKAWKRAGDDRAAKTWDSTAPPRGQRQAPPAQQAIEANDPEIEKRAAPILDGEDQLALVRAVLKKLGYAGSTASAELLYLMFHSRILPRPTNVALVGPSAAGKSHTAEVAMLFHPPEAVYLLTASSERLLIYSDESFENRYVVVAEAAGLARDGVAATVIRELVWGGRGIRYGTVEKVDGELRARVIEKPGPTGLITTTTRSLDPEVETRLFKITVSDRPEQTREVMRSIAAAAAIGGRPDIDFSTWHAAARWLAARGAREAIVPFAPNLAEMVPADDVRLRRDLTQIITIIQIHAIVHQRTRSRDDRGRVVADRRDYEAAFRLLESVLAITVDDVGDATRETVEAVRTLSATMPKEEGVSYPKLAAHLKMSRSGAKRRGKATLAAGYLINLETIDRKPARLRLGDPLPDPRPVLPSPENLFAGAHLSAVSPESSVQVSRGAANGVTTRKTAGHSPGHSAFAESVQGVQSVQASVQGKASNGAENTASGHLDTPKQEGSESVWSEEDIDRIDDEAYWSKKRDELAWCPDEDDDD